MLSFGCLIRTLADDRYYRLSGALLISSCLTLVSPVKAADVYLTVDGEVATTLRLSETDFKALPRAKLAVKDEQGRDQFFEGVNLSLILLRAGVPLRANLKGADVAKYLHAEGKDGFVAVFALPEFDRQDFLVADTHNGAALPPDAGPIQIISPSEARRSRWVKRLALLRIIKAH